MLLEALFDAERSQKKSSGASDFTEPIDRKEFKQFKQWKKNFQKYKDQQTLVSALKLK
jgi:hypothetical protein